MYTRVGRSYVSMLRLVDPPLGPVGTHPMDKQKVKKRRHLPMCTRTRGYLVVDVITIIMLLMLYAIMLNYVKNLKKKTAFAYVYAYFPQGTFNLICVLDRVRGQ